MPRDAMKRLLALLLAVVLLLAGYVAAGPWLTIHAIRGAIRSQDAAALSRQVDFPRLRASLKAQLVDAMLRKAGPDAQSSALGTLALTVATGVVNASVDTMVNPAGLAGLMQGRSLWRSARDSFRRPATGADGLPVAERPPLQDARLRYESTSRFTATIHDEAGRPVVFVLHRDGLRWRLADIRLPLAAD